MAAPSPQSIQSDPSAPGSAWYLAAMERLVGVVQELSKAHDHAAITGIVRDAARELTGADGATFVLRDGDQCYYADENAISPLWKGRRFPMSACISGWVMLNARSTVIEDIYSDPRIPADAYRPTFVKSLAMVPIRRSAPIGAIGNYWATRRQPADEEVAILQALADTTSVALRNADLYAELQQQVHALEEQQTQIREQRDALEVFTRALAHDLKEPVRTIRSFSEIIRQTDVPPPKAAQYFNFIQRAGDRMGRLIDTVFLYTQLDDPERLTKQPCSTAQALQAAQENLTHLIVDKAATVTAGTMPNVFANSVQITQVLQNLLSNAVRHSDKPVSVNVQAEEQADIWRFSVRDDGPGIAPEHLEKIFQPFKRLKADPDCCGLGLAICRKVVGLHGGRIWCESVPGEGSTFYFTLPREMPETAEPVATPESAPELAAKAGKEIPPLANVLLVDDLEDHLELTRLMLFDTTGVTCNVMSACDGPAALRLIRQTQRDRDPIDLILLDINMPGMDGFEMMEHLRQDDELKDIAVIMCTGSNYEKDRERADTLGAVGYLVKPPSWDRLQTMLYGIECILLKQDERGIKLVRAA